MLGVRDILGIGFWQFSQFGSDKFRKLSSRPGRFLQLTNINPRSVEPKIRRELIGGI